MVVAKDFSGNYAVGLPWREWYSAVRFFSAFGEQVTQCVPSESEATLLLQALGGLNLCGQALAVFAITVMNEEIAAKT